MLNLSGIYLHVRQARKTEMSKIEVGLNIWWSVKESYFLEFMNVNVARGFGYCVNNENVLESDFFLTAHLIA